MRANWIIKLIDDELINKDGVDFDKIELKTLFMDIQQARRSMNDFISIDNIEKEILKCIK